MSNSWVTSVDSKTLSTVTPSKAFSITGSFSEFVVVVESVVDTVVVVVVVAFVVVLVVRAKTKSEIQRKGNH